MTYLDRSAQNRALYEKIITLSLEGHTTKGMEEIISRPATSINRIQHELVKENILIKHGARRNRHYELGKVKFVDWWVSTRVNRNVKSNGNVSFIKSPEVVEETPAVNIIEVENVYKIKDKHYIIVDDEFVLIPNNIF